MSDITLTLLPIGFGTKFDIDLNIILADVEIVADALVGGTVVIFQGERRRIEDAIEYLRQHSVKVEVIKDADVSD